ncbi:hypothetical protein Tco_0993795 [Tanacetum coccineum]
MALENYGVAHGYQLWYMKNDWRQVLVYYGRNVVEGRCAGKKGNKHKVLPKKVRTSLFRGDEGNQASKKLVKKPVNKKPNSQSGEGTSQSPKWIKKQIQNSKKCKRAKQLALFDHEGGLIEHYAKLYQYRQALLESNPGSTCTLDVVESDNGSVSFKRMYICFKGKKDGWLAGCKKLGRHNYTKYKEEVRDTQGETKWIVYPSGFQELEVRKGDQSYDVSLHTRYVNVGCGN